MQLKVNVSRQAINQGECRESGGCAVAIAVRRAVQQKLRRRTANMVSVAGYITVELDNGRMYQTLVPRRVSNFIDQFDYSPKGKRQHLKPFSFNLRLS